MKAFLFAGFAALVASGALAQAGAGGDAGGAPKTADFVAQAASADMFEIEAGKLAARRADAPARAFAEEMVKDHRKTTQELKALVAGGKVEARIPQAMTAAQQAALAALKGLQGEDFTRQYLAGQTQAHEQAVDLFARYGEGGDNAALKAWASKTLPDLEEHLRMARNLAR